VDLQSYSGVSKGAAILGTFFFSAVFHELIFSVSFKTFRPWFFAGAWACHAHSGASSLASRN